MFSRMYAFARCGAILMTFALGQQASPASERFHSLFDPQPFLRDEPRPTGLEPHMKWVILKELHLERLEVRSPGAEYNSQVRRVLDRFTHYRGLVVKELGAITQLDLEQFVIRRRTDLYRGKLLSARTINNEIAILNAIFAWCGPPETRGPGRSNLGLLQRPPFLTPLDEPDVEPVAVSDEQLVNYLRATQRATSPRIRGCSPQTFWTCVLLLDGVTMLRRGGLLRIIRPTDYELLELKQLKLPAGINKSKRDEWLSLGSRASLLELLAALPSQPGEPLLPWRDRTGRAMSLNHFSRTMAKFQRDAGISDTDRVRLKQLRSTGATEVGDEFNDAVAKRKLKHGPTTNTFDQHYKSRRPTAAEHEASNYLADKLLRGVAVSQEKVVPQLGVFG